MGKRLSDADLGSPSAKYAGLLFKLGYLITRSEIESNGNFYIEHVLSNWTRRRSGGYFIYHDPDLPFHAYGTGDESVVVLGNVIDPVNMMGDPADIVRTLCSRLATSTDGFFEHLDDLSGRFVLLAGTASRTFIVQDAAGNKTAFYDLSGDGTAVSSHASLIAELKGYRVAPYAWDFVGRDDYQVAIRCFPGVLTPYPHVAILTPNTLLDLENVTVERFFPRVPLKTGRLDTDLIDEVSELLKSQATLLDVSHELSLSITGGMDSRTTLAALRDVSESVFCYSYFAKENQRPDNEVASRLCRSVGLDHVLYRVDEDSIGDDIESYMEVWRKNTSFMRNESQGWIGKVLYEEYPQERLHLKSNISEVGRAFFRSNCKRILPAKPTPADLAARYKVAPRSEFVLGAYTRFIDQVGLKPEAAFNYDIYDLFYWEHTMGAWQSLQTMDLDVAQDTFILYNNRRLLTRMLSVPLKDRLWDRVHIEIIRSLWPELLEVPFYKQMKPVRVRAQRYLGKKVKYSMESLLRG